MIEAEVLAAIYVRSLGSGCSAIYRVAGQRDACDAKALELDADIGRVYVEYDVLGPELHELLRAISDGQTRYVITTESTWGGLYSELRQQVERQIAESGATLIICSDA